MGVCREDMLFILFDSTEMLGIKIGNWEFGLLLSSEYG